MIGSFLGKSIKILAILLGIFIISALVVPNFIDLNKYSQSIVDKIIDKTGKKISIKGKISLSISSQIKLVIPNISIYTGDEKKPENIVEAGALVLRTPLYNFLFGNRSFDNAELQDANINRDNKASHISNLVLLGRTVGLKSFTIKNSILYDRSNPDKPLYNQVNVRVDFLKYGSTKMSGSFLKDNENVNINGQLEEPQQGGGQTVTLSINNQNIDINFQGNVKFLESSGEDLEGNVKIKVRNPSLLVNYLAVTIPILEDMQKLSLDKDINILGDVSYVNNFLEVKNIKISSDHTNGNGSFSLSFVDDSNLKIDFDFDSIDLNQFLSFSNNKGIEVSSSEVFVDTSRMMGGNNFYINPVFMGKADISLKLTAKKVIIQKVALEDLNFRYAVDNNIINEGVLEFNIHNDELSSRFSIANLAFSNVAKDIILLGQFSNEGNNINKTLELFNLTEHVKIQEKSLNYSIKSKIIFAPQEISIFDITGSIGEKGKVSGSIATKQDVINDYKVDLKFSNLNLVSFELPLFQSRLLSLLTDSDDDRYLSKFIWFRTLTSTYNIKLAFDNAELKDNKIIDNLTVLCELSPANMSIKGAVKSSFADGNFILGLTVSSIMPSLDIKMDGNKLDYNVLGELLSNFIKTSADNYQKPDNQIWSDQPLKPFSIYKYAANFDIDIKSLQFREKELKNFNLSARTANDALYIENLAMDIYGGVFQARGNISFFGKLLYQFSFSGSDFKVQDLLNEISPQINAFNGPISFNGSIVTEGRNVKELVSNLGISSNFASASMILNGIDSDMVVDIALEREKIDKDQVLDSLDVSLNKGTTDMLELTGNFKGEKGVIASNNITFKTRFNSSITAIYLDLNTMALSSNTQFLFLPYDDPDPISYNIFVSGNLKGSLGRKTDSTNLIKYVKSAYDIVTAEDILEARKLNKQIERKKKSVIENPNDKNYLYYKLQEQEIAEKDKAEEAEVLKNLDKTKKE